MAVEAADLFCLHRLVHPDHRRVPAVADLALECMGTGRGPYGQDADERDIRC